MCTAALQTPEEALIDHQSGYVAGREELAYPNNDFVRAGNLYRDAMTDSDRDNLISNIGGHLSGASRAIRERQMEVFKKVAPEYGARVAEGIGLGKG